MTRKPIFWLALLAACALGWGVYVTPQPQSASAVSSALSDRPLPAAAPAVAALPASALMTQAAGTRTTAVSSVTVVNAAADQGVGLRQQINALGLTRELTGAQSVTYDGRTRTVLGTKETTNSQSTQTVLLIRDDTSGQIDYWQPALRIVLKPGNDYETFVRERPALQRRFVNIEHAQVAVDAASIAKEHAAMTADARVASVDFIPVAVRPTAR